MRYVFLLIGLVFYGLGYSQEVTIDSLDTKYREDQFYVSISYNLLTNGPDGFSQNGISTGFHLGFIRDMPINKRRNWAIGLGFGLSSNSYNQELRIAENSGEFSYSIIDDSEINVSKNKFTRYLLEVPLELRWRSSNASKYKFWRIYSGIKLGYLAYSTAKFKSSMGDITVSNIEDFNTFQYGLTLSAGYNTWNFQLYYGLNNLFNETAQIDGESINLRAVKIGIIFYIL